MKTGLSRRHQARPERAARVLFKGRAMDSSAWRMPSALTLLGGQTRGIWLNPGRDILSGGPRQEQPFLMAEYLH